ncbi:hypothetical protein HYE67_009788 [Fusarium culmorum]|uniref:Uncharacterized protein n=1 Tax=Fusarium culmorum TaxID=5516 RepID=A0A2T4H9D4_FUSCU|nr:hypothetical protein FCULG_00004722 [Fusarium culmorum]QPC67557.1 hypothetical protein HYE67_009788 [Fusarium culmorum]
MNRNRSTGNPVEIEDEDNMQTSTHLGISIYELALVIVTGRILSTVITSKYEIGSSRGMPPGPM